MSTATGSGEERRSPLLEVTSITRDFRLPRTSLVQPAARLRVLHGISLKVERGVSVGLIGESGGGKSTLARIAVALDRPDLGTVRFDGEDLFAVGRRRRKALRRRMQMVFQDPYGSLDPRHTVGRIIAEPLVRGVDVSDAADRRRKISAGLAAVGLVPQDAGRYPHEFSGGQRQRIAIARALMTTPELIVADEPVSSLDPSVQAQILNLMMDLKERSGVTYLFISHDLSVVRHVTERVAVLYLGHLVEEGPTSAVFAHPVHPYTAALVAAVPRPDPARRRTPRPVEPEIVPPRHARNCPYAPLCPRARERCRSEMPPSREVASGRRVSCFYPLD